MSADRTGSFGHSDDTSTTSLETTDVGPIPWATGLDDGETDLTTETEDIAAECASAEDPADIGAGGWKDVLMRVKDEMKDDHVTLSAAGVAFFFFTALVPLLGAAISLYGLIAQPSDVLALVNSFGPAVPEAFKDLIEEQLGAVTGANRGALGLGFVIGLASGLWSASSGFGHLIEGLNIAFDEEESRPFVKKKLLSLALTLAFMVLLGAVTFVVTTVTGLADGAVSIVESIAGWSLAAVLLGAFLAVLFRYGPNREEPKWVWVSPGSIFTVAAWTLLSIGFGIYVSRFASYNETYGSLGAIVVILSWMYLTAVIVMVGAEITSELERESDSNPAPGR